MHIHAHQGWAYHSLEIICVNSDVAEHLNWIDRRATGSQINSQYTNIQVQFIYNGRHTVTVHSKWMNESNWKARHI